MNFAENVSVIIDDLELEKPYDKAIIKNRFLDEITYYEKKRNETKKFYNIFRFIVTTGSILLPAILSMGQMDPTKLPRNFDMFSYWCSWTISLMVTGSNGFLQLFSLDKNYFSYSMVVEQLKTEGWQFFGLSGKYEDYPDHQSAYKTFSKSVESIKRKQVDQEFSNGKGGNKKKKFDFKGEMEKFANEQNANLELKNQTPAPSNINPSSIISEMIPKGKTAESIKDIQKESSEIVSAIIEDTTNKDK
tara:strand:+ start:22066 stop:22806 length:741 start_codon:yes stop_codon:yes gene_type:complete